MFEDVEEGYLDGEKESKFHYFYNREERIANAPQNVKDYYNGGMRPITGFKVLFKNKSNRFILLTLVFFIAFTWLYSGLNNTRDTCKIDNVLFQLQAFPFEEEIFVTLKTKPQNQNNHNPEFINVPIEVEFLFVNNDNAVAQKDIIIDTITSEEKYLRTRSIDYDIIRVDAKIKIWDTEKELTAFVKR